MATEDLIGVSQLLLQLHQFPGDLTGSRGYIDHHALQIGDEALTELSTASSSSSPLIAMRRVRSASPDDNVSILPRSTVSDPSSD